MKLQELENKLKVLNIPRGELSLKGGLPNEAFCINSTEGVWETYYSQRGRKSCRKEFMSESEACEYFYGWMVKKFKS